ncbi:MAG TPA: TRAP transporter small permease subunit [Rhodospirillales bacterium]|nr:TRAP transporter small permease subunit [Rhodospirillales bacterium]
MLGQLRRFLEILLAIFTVSLLLILTGVVVIAVVYRKLGASLSWYDEIAVILLAWITYYGSALASLKRAHIGFPNLVQAMPAPLRLLAVLLAELAVIAFFLLLAWTGWWVMEVLEGDTLVSLTWVPTSFTQSVIPVASLLVVLAQLLTMPEMLRRALHGVRLGDPHGPAAEEHP